MRAIKKGEISVKMVYTVTFIGLFLIFAVYGLFTVYDVRRTEKAADKKPAQKTAPKKEDAQVYFEFGGKQFDPAVVAENVKKAYVSAGHKASSIKSLKVYIKAEDNAAYFVINNKETGKIVL